MESAPQRVGVRFNRRSILRGVGIGVLLVSMLLGYAPPGTSVAIHAGAPSAGGAPPASLTPAETSVMQAETSLQTGAGPAMGRALSCGGSLAASSSCSPATASPRADSIINGDWVNVTSSLFTGAAVPEAVYVTSMCYDAADGYVLAFGGYNDATEVTADTWTYQNGSWTELFPANAPPARTGAQLAYDPADQEVVLFSGYDYNAGSFVNDTWTYHAGNWTQLSYTVGPEERWRGGFAYDAETGYMVLTGGTDSAGTALMDTWAFSNNTWTDLTSKITGGAPGLYRTTMTYDDFDHEIVLFGGSSNSASATDETWVYQNLTWSEVHSTNSPADRVYPSLGYDPARDAVIMTGGSPDSGTGTPFSDTWSFQNGNWTELDPATSAPATAYTQLVWDPMGGYMLEYGGYTNTEFLYNTWTFNSPIVVWANISPATPDAGKLTAINLTVVSKLTGLSTYFDGLPGGCTSENVLNLSCTPTEPGNFTLLVGANDTMGDNASANLTLDVRADPAVAGFTYTPAAVDVGFPTWINATVTGGSPPFDYNWTALPPGCSDQDSPSINCTATKSGTFPIAVTVRDSAGVKTSGSSSLTVNALPTINEFVAAPAVFDQGASTTLYANVTAGTAPFTYTWPLLPGGCQSANTSALVCKPIAIGNYRVEAIATDIFGAEVTGNFSVSVVKDLAIGSTGVSESLLDAGQPLTIYVNATTGSGVAPFKYTFSGLPGGCTPVGGARATCTPTAPGSFGIVVSLTDAVGYTATSKPILLTVNPDTVITGFNATPGVTDVSHTVIFTVNATGGDGLYTYSYTGLPSGCDSSDDAVLTCTPLVSGHFTVTATVADSEGVAASANLNLTVGPTFRVFSFVATPSSLAPGSSISLAVTPTGGVAPFTYSYSGLPAGCTSSNTDLLKCTPTATGSFTIRVTVTDQAYAVAVGNVSVSIQKSSTAFLSSGLGLGLIIGIPIIIVVVALLVVLMRRKPAPPAATKAAAPPPSKPT